MTFAQLTTEGRVSMVTLNRPERLNAISGDLLVDLHAALVQAQADPTTGAIVLTGAGRAFCAGDDLKEFDQQSESPAAIALHCERIQQITRDIMFGPKLVVGAVHGYAVGGGFEWVLNCDLVVAADTLVCFFPEMALGHFNARSEWWEKAPGDPVGVADLEVDAYLKAALIGARPDDGWLSEETADTADRLEKRRVWLVDPIDGTRDFVRGRTGWAISVALVVDGAVAVAALAAPARGQLFVAARGQGATCNGVPLRVSALESLIGVRLPMDAANLSAPFWPAPWPGEPRVPHRARAGALRAR
jgi:hypothetical protein